MSFPKGSLGSGALYYASLGWPVFPLAVRDKVPMLRGGNGCKDATTDPEQITRWWTQHPEANIGLATGGAIGLYVVDVDGEDGEAALRRYGPLPVVPESTTGKGRHLLFLHPDGKNTAGNLGPKIDTRGAGGYIVAPPSIHPSGRRYQWVVSPAKAALQPLPQPIRDVLTSVAGRIEPVAGARQAAVDVVLHGVQEGGRNQALTEYVGRLLAKGLRELEVLELARGVNATKFTPPLPPAEVEAVVRSVAAAHDRNRQGVRVVGSASDPQVVQPLAPIAFSTFEDMLDKAAKPVDAMATMWPTWNKACRMYGGGVGLARGWHTVVAGGAGVGKSLVALNLTAAALLGGHSVGWVSLEMSKEQLLLRLLGIVTGQRLSQIEPGHQFDGELFTAAAAQFLERTQMAGAKLWMAERPSRDLMEVDRLMGAAVDAGCRLIVLDYFQLVSVTGVPKMDDAMRQVSATVQSRAYRDNVNTLALSQFNRSTTGNAESKPTIFGLMGGSSLENDADQIILLDHTSRQTSGTSVTMNALLEKNRHGPSAEIAITMDTRTLRMTEPSAQVMRGPTAWYEEA
jgi:KaiC/GvpD/RAD55 family RecA-like ATPase